MELLNKVRECLDKVKAEDIKIYDLRGISPLADYTVIATVQSERSANAAISYLEDACKEGNAKIKGIEGKNSTWILVDMYDIIIHIFTVEERKNYNLDRLYIDVPQV